MDREEMMNFDGVQVLQYRSVQPSIGVEDWGEEDGMIEMGIDLRVSRVTRLSVGLSRQGQSVGGSERAAAMFGRQACKKRKKKR